jgi:hypothetical protein
MITGNSPSDGGHLIMSYSEGVMFSARNPDAACFLRKFIGSRELINGGDRWCLWIEANEVEKAKENSETELSPHIRTVVWD